MVSTLLFFRHQVPRKIQDSQNRNPKNVKITQKSAFISVYVAVNHYWKMSIKIKIVKKFYNKLFCSGLI